MAYHIGVMGEQNSGKSYARRSIVDGDKCFILNPSAKATHLFSTNEDGSRTPVKRFNFASDKNATTESLLPALNTALKTNFKNAADLMNFFNAQPSAAASFLEPNAEGKARVTFSGNHINLKIEQVEGVLRFVSDRMPHINTIFIGDFMHFISNVIARKEFIERKAGGEAFQRFWELAGTVLQSLIECINTLRDDLVVITEYHTQYNENTGVYSVFVPGGNMLTEKFKLESYYDFMLCTNVELNDDGSVKQYQFVTERLGKYNARFSNILPTVIPNDLGLVLNKFREYTGI